MGPFSTCHPACPSGLAVLGCSVHLKFSVIPRIACCEAAAVTHEDVNAFHHELLPSVLSLQFRLPHELTLLKQLNSQ